MENETRHRKMQRVFAKRGWLIEGVDEHFERVEAGVSDIEKLGELAEEEVEDAESKN